MATTGDVCNRCLLHLLTTVQECDARDALIVVIEPGSKKKYNCRYLVQLIY
jgi:hypothetical protein